jgi:ABC-type phosphate/phosphonate transport system ATPase subunit/GNAT superfamily N-acetyltransferase
VKVTRRDKDSLIGNSFTVRRIVSRNHLKEVFFNESKAKLQLPRSACVTDGDVVEFNKNNVSVVCENGRAQLLPIYFASENLQIGNLNLEFLFKEITESEEQAAYKALTQFHYRTHVLFGRTARLVVRNFHPLYPKIIGYIELTTPFFMNKARAAVLDAPFKANGISWQAWDIEARRQYINLIVRIARCVIYPEFRGLGLGQLLIKHASEFARRHWHIAGLKPYFIEISADMLKFVPFAQKADMVFIGETEGNLKRAARDMSYLLRTMQRAKEYCNTNEEVCGFLDQQIARANKAADLVEREGWTLDELKARLKALSKSITLRDQVLFQGIISFPKPTYLQGLNLDARRFVRERASIIAPRNGHQLPPLKIESLHSPIVFENVSLTFESQVRRTWQTQAIQQAFDISPEDISHKVIHKLSLTIAPGQIILLTGASGSGKSTLLRLLAEQKHRGLTGKIRWANNYAPGTFTPIRSKRALIELLGTRDVKAALYLMGLVGLSDAFIYLKRFDELSNGQQYRAMLARLIVSNCNIWLADEFCANLDPLTAHLVSDRLQRIARQVGAAVIVASSQPETFAASLRPDLVINLTTAWEHHRLTGSEFMRSLPNRSKSFNAPYLKVAPEYMPAIRAGRKRTTIRKGRKTFNHELILLKTKTDFEPVKITNIRYTAFKCLNEEDAINDGFDSLEELRFALFSYYPDLQDDSWVTIVSFELLSSAFPRRK